MNIFLDSEFTGLHQGTTLISIGLIAETGETFYAEFTDYDESQINDWLRENVLSNLLLVEGVNSTFLNSTTIKGTTTEITHYLSEWLNQFKTVHIWSDCLAYDWVLFCQLFGGALQLPENIYYIPFDICTLFFAKGIDSDVSREEYAEIKGRHKQKHNSIFDAYVIRACYLKLMEETTQ